MGGEKVNGCHVLAAVNDGDMNRRHTRVA